MRLITRADEDLFHTVTLATKLGRAAGVIERLSARYADEWDNAEAGFPYALAMIAVLQTSGTDFEKHAGYNEVIETLGDVLYADPDHWLARYCRVRIRALIPTTYSVYRNYIDNERAKAVADVEELIGRQSAADPQPYFACTYLLAARMAGDGQPDTRHDTQRTTRLIAQAAAVPGRPVPFRALGAMLCESFVAYHNEPDAPDRELVAKTMHALFPDQPAVLGALYQYPSR